MGHGLTRENGISSPRAVSTTQPMWQYPFQEERDSAGRAVMSGLGSACCHAIRQDLRSDEDNAALRRGGNSVLTRHITSQRYPMSATPADYGVGSSSDEAQPIHVLDECQHRMLKVGQLE